MFLYRRGIFIIDMYILYSSYDFRFTPSIQYFCTDVVYLLLTDTLCIRLMTFVSPLRLNVSVQRRIQNVHVNNKYTTSVQKH
jgi:hypothetical protein